MNTRKINKEEKKILVGLIVKVVRFVGTLNPTEITLLSKIITGKLLSSLEIEDDDE